MTSRFQIRCTDGETYYFEGSLLDLTRRMDRVLISVDDAQGRSALINPQQIVAVRRSTWGDE